MSEETAIQVNFGRAMPLFPLDTTALLPQQVLPLHVFEPRYYQMVSHVLDGPGQFAMAVFKGDGWKKNYHGRPALRPAVCIGQIVRHEELPENRYNLLLQGVCRARLVKEAPPEQGRLYRMAMLAPIGIDAQDEDKIYGVRERLRELLSDGPLSRLTYAAPLLDHIRNEEIPTTVIMELVGSTLPGGREFRYRLLEEGDAGERAEILEREMLSLQRLIGTASRQRPDEWPKGCSWN